MLDQGQCNHSLLTQDLINNPLQVLVSCGHHRREFHHHHFKLKRLDPIKVHWVEAAWEDLSVGKVVMLLRQEASHKLHQELLLHR